MKNLISILFLVIFGRIGAFAQSNSDQRVIIITTDGLRWQEVFKGMDQEIAQQKRFHHGDSLSIFKKYWDPNPQESRKKLMPFFWGDLVKNGQIHGNRGFGNFVDNANPYWFSYPGYSEILTGQVDTLVNSNEYKPNPNTNFLEHLNQMPAYKGKVAAFGAWGAFDRILNEKRAGFPVVNAYDSYPAIENDPQSKLIANMLKDSYKVFGEGEAMDVFTHYKALHYLKTRKPKAIFISYGDTDEFAHEGNYVHYLNATHQFDQWVGEIWNFVNNDKDYKGKTTLLVTTDHGRGDVKKEEWTSHGQSISDAHQIWYAIIGPKIPALGELKTSNQEYQKNLIHKLAKEINVNFKSRRLD